MAALFVCPQTSKVCEEGAKPGQDSQELRGSRMNRTAQTPLWLNGEPEFQTLQTVTEATMRDSIGPRASYFSTRLAAAVQDIEETEVSYLLKILRQHVECCEIKSSLSDLLQEKLVRLITNCPASKRFTLRTSTLDNRRRHSICGILRPLIISSSWSFGKLVLYLDIWPRLRP